MKLLKRITLIATLTVLLGLPTQIHAVDPIKVTLDDVPILFTVDPLIHADSTLVQAQPIFKRMGFAVSWDNMLRVLIAEKAGLSIRLPIDSTTAYINGKSVALQAPARIIDEVTVVPIRFISEASGYEVTWDTQTKTVIIQSPEPVQSSSLTPTGEEAYNVNAFGAKGDGITDDTLAVKRALKAGTKAQGTIYFPKGIYIIDASMPMVLKSHTRLLGDGKSSILKAKKDVGFGSSMIKLSGEHIQISQLSMDGNFSVINVVLINSGSTNITIDHSTVANASQSNDPSRDDYDEIVSGIMIYGNTRDIIIDQTEVRMIKAIHPNAGSLVARGIYLTENYAGWQEKAAKLVSITNNYIHDIGPADDGDCIYYEDPSLVRNAAEDTKSVIANNRMEGCAKRGIKIYAQGIRITGNTIINNHLNNNYYQGEEKGMLAPDMFAAISIYADNNTVVDNIIEGVGSYYAAIEVTAEQTVHNVIVSGNRITMGVTSNLDGKTAIRVGDVDGFTIHSNELRNGGIGIWLCQNAVNGSIKDNIIHMPNGGGINLLTYLANTIKQEILISSNVITASEFEVNR